MTVQFTFKNSNIFIPSDFHKMAVHQSVAAIAEGVTWTLMENLFDASWLGWQAVANANHQQREEMGVLPIKGNNAAYHAVREVVDRWLDPKFKHWVNLRPYRYQVRDSAAVRTRMTPGECKEIVDILNTLNEVPARRIRVYFATITPDGLFIPGTHGDTILITSHVLVKLQEQFLDELELQATACFFMGIIFHELTHLIRYHIANSHNITYIDTPPPAAAGFGNEVGFFNEYVYYGGVFDIAAAHRVPIRRHIGGVTCWKYNSWADNLTIVFPPHTGAPQNTTQVRWLKKSTYALILAPRTPWIGQAQRGLGQHSWLLGPAPNWIGQGISAGNTLVGNFKPRGHETLSVFIADCLANPHLLPTEAEEAAASKDD